MKKNIFILLFLLQLTGCAHQYSIRKPTSHNIDTYKGKAAQMVDEYNNLVSTSTELLNEKINDYNSKSKILWHLNFWPDMLGAIGASYIAISADSDKTHQSKNVGIITGTMLGLSITMKQLSGFSTRVIETNSEVTKKEEILSNAEKSFKEIETGLRSADSKILQESLEQFIILNRQLESNCH
ncbi:MAG: hypothetical protein HY919_07950 [Elusimicrobia bacterium]|nr:hypothetical protein [Elusimicrobiota bacterium]